MALDKDDLVQIEEISVRTITAALNEIVLPRFDEHDQRFDQLESRMDGLEGRMDGLEGRMDAQERATNDLKSEMRSGFATLNKRIDNLSDELNGRIDALEADVRQLYLMVSKLEQGTITDKKFANLSLKKKLLTLNAELLETAKQAGITLPR
ncbi:MAG: hypothetical protein ACRD4B_00350 [Acidobacteriota bacterium]